MGADPLKGINITVEMNVGTDYPQSLPKPVTLRSHNKEFKYHEGSCHVIPQYAGTVYFTLSKGPADVKWFILRNDDDFCKKEAKPHLVPDSNPLKASMNTDKRVRGSFNVIAYSSYGDDSVHDPRQDNAHILAYVNVVIISLKYESSTIQYDNYGLNNNWTSYLDPDGVTQVFASGDTSVKAMNSSATLVIEGGGEDGFLGMRRNKIHVGWIGNLLAENRRGYYSPSANYYYKTPDLTDSLPGLDTARAYAGTGGWTAFREASYTSEVTTHPLPPYGARYVCVADDDPKWGFKNLFPGSSILHATTAAGASNTLDFNDFFCAYSDEFSKAYTVIGQFTWSQYPAFTYDRIVDYWNNVGSQTTGDDELTTTGFPKSATDANMKFLFPNIQSFMVDHYYSP